MSNTTTPSSGSRKPASRGGVLACFNRQLTEITIGSDSTVGGDVVNRSVAEKYLFPVVTFSADSFL